MARRIDRTRVAGIEVTQHENRDRQRHGSGPRGVAPGGAYRRRCMRSPGRRDDGAEAVALARADTPDLILMDLFMPGTDGVEATRRIMGESPCAILVVTATVTGHLSKVYQAMGYGAWMRSTHRPWARGARSPAPRCSCTRSRSSASCSASRQSRPRIGRPRRASLSSAFAFRSGRAAARSLGCAGSLDRRSPGLGGGPLPASARL